MQIPLVVCSPGVGKMSHGVSHGCLTDVALDFSGSCLSFRFTFMICDMIGCGMMCGDVMMNSFMFLCESR